MQRLSILVVVLAVAVGPGCGGGGGAADPVTVVLTSTGALEGHVFVGGTVTLSSNIGVGDYANGAGPQGGLRGFASFDISGIPAGATVTAATLTFVQRLVNSDPYATLGTVVIDQVVYGTVLDAGAYDRSFPSNHAFATLSTDSTLGAKSVDARIPVQADVAAQRGQSQFRLRFQTEDDLDLDSDQAVFWSAESATVATDLPTLTITYQP